MDIERSKLVYQLITDVIEKCSLILNHENFDWLDDIQKTQLRDLSEWCSHTKSKFGDEEFQDGVEVQLKDSIGNLNITINQLNSFAPNKSDEVQKALSTAKELWVTVKRLESHSKLNRAVEIYPKILADLEDMKSSTLQFIQNIESGTPVPRVTLESFTDSANVYFKSLEILLSVLDEELPPRTSN